MPKLYVYHVSQTEVGGYDTFSDFVCIAESEAQARDLHPRGASFEAGQSLDGYGGMWNDWESSNWAATPQNVQVQLIGTAQKGSKVGVVCASFHAG